MACFEFKNIAIDEMINVTSHIIHVDSSIPNLERGSENGLNDGNEYQQYKGEKRPRKMLKERYNLLQNLAFLKSAII